MPFEDIVQEHEQRITKLEVEVDGVKKAVGNVCDDFKEFTREGGAFDQLQQVVNKVSASGDTLVTLIKYVILPLIIIVGALVGVKIAWPGA